MNALPRRGPFLESHVPVPQARSAQKRAQPILDGTRKVAHVGNLRLAARRAWRGSASPLLRALVSAT